MLKHRLVVGALLIAGLLALLWADARLDAAPLPGWAPRAWGGASGTLPPGTALFVGALVVSAMAARELARILRENQIPASTRVTCLAAITGLAVSCLVPSGTSAQAAVAIQGTAAAGVLLVALVFYARHRSFEGIVGAAGGTVLAYVSLGLMLGFFLAIRRTEPVSTLLWVLLTTKSGDIGAFAVGTMIGRHKLIPWLSPGKTWEGLLGGMALAAVVGALGAWALGEWTGRAPVSAGTGAAAGGVLAVVGHAGDLVMSLFKRDAGRKDSGTALPGFGGVLDVIDSLLLAGPAAYWLLAWNGGA